MDRETIVSRHRPSLTSINTSEVAVLGNGAFALSIDVTGLQTLNRTFSGVPNASSPYRCRCPAHADVFFPLMTGSDWGWHSFKPPGPPGSRADPFAPPQATIHSAVRDTEDPCRRHALAGIIIVWRR